MEALCHPLNVSYEYSLTRLTAAEDIIEPIQLSCSLLWNRVIAMLCRLLDDNFLKAFTVPCLSKVPQSDTDEGKMFLHQRL